MKEGGDGIDGLWKEKKKKREKEVMEDKRQTEKERKREQEKEKMNERNVKKKNRSSFLIKAEFLFNLLSYFVSTQIGFEPAICSLVNP